MAPTRPVYRCLARLVVCGALVGTLGACDDSDRPVDIPFTGKEVRAGGPKKKKLPPPPPSETAPAPKPKPKVRVSGVAACCHALAGAERKASSEGDKANYKVAASLCYRLDKEVRAGKRSKSQALSRVRSSLLQGAPAACR